MAKQSLKKQKNKIQMRLHNKKTNKKQKGGANGDGDEYANDYFDTNTYTFTDNFTTLELKLYTSVSYGYGTIEEGMLFINNDKNIFKALPNKQEKCVECHLYLVLKSDKKDVNSDNKEITALDVSNYLNNNNSNKNNIIKVIKQTKENIGHPTIDDVDENNIYDINIDMLPGTDKIINDDNNALNLDAIRKALIKQSTEIKKKTEEQNNALINNFNKELMKSSNMITIYNGNNNDIKSYTIFEYSEQAGGADPSGDDSSDSSDSRNNDNEHDDNDDYYDNLYVALKAPNEVNKVKAIKIANYLSDSTNDNHINTIDVNNIEKPKNLTDIDELKKKMQDHAKTYDFDNKNVYEMTELLDNRVGSMQISIESLVEKYKKLKTEAENHETGLNNNNEEIKKLQHENKTIENIISLIDEQGYKTDYNQKNILKEHLTNLHKILESNNNSSETDGLNEHAGSDVNDIKKDAANDIAGFRENIDNDEKKEKVKRSLETIYTNNENKRTELENKQDKLKTKLININDKLKDIEDNLKTTNIQEDSNPPATESDLEKIMSNEPHDNNTSDNDNKGGNYYKKRHAIRRSKIGGNKRKNIMNLLQKVRNLRMKIKQLHAGYNKKNTNKKTIKMKRNDRKNIKQTKQQLKANKTKKSVKRKVNNRKFKNKSTRRLR